MITPKFKLQLICQFSNAIIFLLVNIVCSTSVHFSFVKGLSIQQAFNNIHTIELLFLTSFLDKLNSFALHSRIFKRNFEQIVCKESQNLHALFLLLFRNLCWSVTVVGLSQKSQSVSIDTAPPPLMNVRGSLSWGNTCLHSLTLVIVYSHLNKNGYIMYANCVCLRYTCNCQVCVFTLCVDL